MIDLLLHYSVSCSSVASKKYLFLPNLAGPGGLTPLHLAACMQDLEEMVDTLTNDLQELGLNCWVSLLDANMHSPQMQLMKRGVQDPPTYKTLILGHCREGTFIDGYEILLEMLKREFVPDVEVYESLIEGFLKKGDSAFGFKTMEKMLKSGHIPKTSLFRYILDQLTRNGCAREAASLVMVMLERRVCQNITLATNTVMALFKSQLKVSAFEIVRLLYNKGYSIKMEKVVDFLCGDKKFAEARELTLFNLEKNLDLEVETYCGSL